MDMFQQLNSINVNDFTEKKSGLTYLTWSHAWSEFKKVCPTATYEIQRFNGGLPYVYDPHTGYMVFTTVTVDNLTHEMWLPVMDSANRAMKSEVYKMYAKDVQPATMFDINKTIMRCLVKNLAMFGLGLYIYAGEDLPEGETTKVEETTEQPQQETPVTQDQDLIEAKAKWLLLGRTENGFETFVKGQHENNKNNKSINNFVTSLLKKHQEEKKNVE